MDFKQGDELHVYTFEGDHDPGWLTTDFDQACEWAEDYGHKIICNTFVCAQSHPIMDFSRGAVAAAARSGA